jgi:hypothetical protein
VYWIELAEHRDKWWAPENTVMNLGVPRNVGRSLTSFSRTLLSGVS